MGTTRKTNADSLIRVVLIVALSRIHYHGIEFAIGQRKHLTINLRKEFRMSILSWIVVGLIAGWLAGIVMKAAVTASSAMSSWAFSAA